MVIDLNYGFQMNALSKPRLNRPPKNSGIDVYNRYDALSDMEEDYYESDQPIT